MRIKRYLRKSNLKSALSFESALLMAVDQNWGYPPEIKSKTTWQWSKLSPAKLTTPSQHISVITLKGCGGSFQPLQQTTLGSSLGSNSSRPQQISPVCKKEMVCKNDYVAKRKCGDISKSFLENCLFIFSIRVFSKTFLSTLKVKYQIPP